GGSALLNKDYHSLPMTMSGDFNVDFNTPQAEPHIIFMKNTLKLELYIDRNVSTTQSGTIIDAGQTCSNTVSNITDDNNYDINEETTDPSLFLKQYTEILQEEKESKDEEIIVE
ncbi:hypothetical protein PV327_011613, partial [Microctonus hyperodae]